MPGVEPGHELLALIQPYVRHCGDSHRPAWSMGPRKLLDFLLVYIAEGKGRFVIAGESYAAEPGDLFWIPPDTLHSMEGFAPGMHCPYVHFDLVYRPSHSHWDFTIPSGMKNLDELRPLLHERVRHPLLLRLKGRIRSHTNRRAGGLIQDICAEAARAQPFAGLLMSGMMTLVVAEILRGKTGLPAEQMAHAPFLEQAADIISRRCHENLRLREIAKSCELSASHFRFLFNRHFGMTPPAHHPRGPPAPASGARTDGRHRHDPFRDCPEIGICNGPQFFAGLPGGRGPCAARVPALRRGGPDARRGPENPVQPLKHARIAVAA